VESKNNMKTCILLVLATLSGCDTFFHLRATVVDSTTGSPLPGTTALLVLDRGIEEADGKITSDEQGYIEIWMNEPEEAWATLTVEKVGYGIWSTQFRGSPKHPLVIRLVPSSPGQRP
jgi:hypothetical protein